MPNGDLLTAPYQVQLGGSIDFLFGAGEHGISLDLTAGSQLTGLFDFVVKTNDVALPGQDGQFFNPDYLDVVQIHIPVILRGADPTSDLVNLVAAWTPQLADIDLYFQIPHTSGVLNIGYIGRPRGITGDLSLKPRNVIRALLRFDVTSGARIPD